MQSILVFIPVITGHWCDFHGSLLRKPSLWLSLIIGLLGNKTHIFTLFCFIFLIYIGSIIGLSVVTGKNHRPLCKIIDLPKQVSGPNLPNCQSKSRIKFFLIFHHYFRQTSKKYQQGRLRQVENKTPRGQFGLFSLAHSIYGFNQGQISQLRVILV